MSAGRYGEPWTREADGHGIVAADAATLSSLSPDKLAALRCQRAERAAVCVNAMRGIDDPAAFMRALRGSMEVVGDMLPRRKGVEL